MSKHIKDVGQELMLFICNQALSFSDFIRSAMFAIFFVCHHTISLNAFTFLFKFTTFSDDDTSLVDYECSVPIVFLT